MPNIFTIEPQQRVQPEEGKGAHQQLQHDLPSHPNLGVLVEITSVTVGLVSGKTHGCQCQVFLAAVAGLTSFEYVGGIQHGLWIVDFGDLVAAVAIETLGGVVVAQFADLTVVSAQIGRQVLFVTRAASVGDGLYKGCVAGTGDRVR